MRCETVEVIAPFHLLLEPTSLHPASASDLQLVPARVTLRVRPHSLPLEADQLPLSLWFTFHVQFPENHSGSSAPPPEHMRVYNETKERGAQLVAKNEEQSVVYSAVRPRAIAFLALTLSVFVCARCCRVPRKEPCFRQRGHFCPAARIDS